MEKEEVARKASALGDNATKMAEYENKVSILSQEIERLNSFLEKRTLNVTT